MLRYARPQAAYPGEWAFILCAKLVTATPAHERAERKREAETVGDGNEGFQELLERAVDGEITGTLGLSATNGTRLPVITPAPTRDVEEEEEEEEEEEDSDYSEGDYPTQTGNATLGPPSGFPELDEGYVIAGGNGLSRGAIAGGVIGALLFIPLLVALFIFRHRIRQKFAAGKYSRMGPTPDPMVTMWYGEPKPSMAKRGPFRSLFSSKTPRSWGADMGLPPPAMVRYSTTTSRRESRNARYIRNSLLRGDGAPGSPPGRRTFYSPRSSSSSTLGSRPRSPPQFHSLSRANSDRFPIAIPSTTSAPSSTWTSPTLADEFFHALSQPKMPLQAPQPVAVIPAFLIPETPVEPKDSHFSWSTTKTPQVPQTPASAVSVADSEPRFRGVNSWVSNQRGRLERQDGVVRQSQTSLPPQTPKELGVHPGRHEL